MAEQERKLPHKLTVDERKRLNLTGAREVLHFDEEQVVLDTCLGILTVQGSDLKLKCLSLDEGAVIIQGHISALFYEEEKKKRGMFR